MYFPDGEQAKRPKHGAPRRRRRTLLVSIIVLGAVLIAGVSVASFGRDAISAYLHPVADFSGTGTASVEFVIADGDTGETIAKGLASAGITESFDAFYKLVLKQDPSPVFIPGVYSLKKEMSAQAALDALLNTENRLVNEVVIPEGTILPKVLALLSSATKIPVAEFQAAAKVPSDFGLPQQAKTLEGFLFPATYSFSPNMTASDLLRQMVTRTFAALDKAKVPVVDQFRVITLASLVQKEAGSVKDMYKVSRVFQNRLNKQIWPTLLLQSDATVAYGTGHTNTWNTTDAERADAGNIYNTYVHPGMLAAPISNPGEDAIDSVLHPATGKWMFFVAVNLETGETVFSETLGQHEAAVAQSQAWWQAHPEYK